MPFTTGPDQGNTISRSWSKKIHHHFEYGIWPIRNDIQWLYCETPAKSGGETTLADGIKMFELLSQQTKQYIIDKKIVIKTLDDNTVFDSLFGLNINQYPDNFYQLLDNIYSQIPNITYTINKNKTVSVVRTVPLIREPKHQKYPVLGESIFNKTFYDYIEEGQFWHFEGGSKVPDWLTNELNDCAESASVDINWQFGDIAMIDNSRFLHGRNKFTDPNRSLWLLMTFDNELLN